MDILVATGAVLTYFYSIYITLFQLGEAYFDSVTMIIAFVLFGKFLEVLSKKSAADTLDVMFKHIPVEVSVVEGETVKVVNVNEVNVGDIVMLKTGEKSALDGIVTEGEGNMDESSLTGESVPVYKQKGDTVISGTISIDAMLRYEVTKDFAHSTLSNLVAMLENSMSKKPRIEQLANRLSEYFSLTILVFSLLTFIVWWLWPHDFDTAFNEVDIIMMPTTPTAAFKIGEKIDNPLEMYLSDIFTVPANLAGIPAISVPYGSAADGRPAGVQFMARGFRLRGDAKE